MKPDDVNSTSSFAMCDLCGRDNTTYPMLDYIFCVADVVRPDGTPDRLTVLCGECRPLPMPEIQARYEQCYASDPTPECPSGSPGLTARQPDKPAVI